MFSVLGATAQGSTIACLMFFVQLIESKQQTTIPLLDTISGRPEVAFLLLTVLLFCLQLFSALTTYFAAVQCRALGRRYHLYAASRLLDMVSHATAIESRDPEFSEQRLRQLMIGSARTLGILIETIAHSIHPLLYALVAFGIMVKLNVHVTVIVTPLFLLMLPAFYRVSARIQQRAKNFFGSAGREMSAQVRDYLKMVNSANVHTQRTSEIVQSRYNSDEKLETYYDAFDQIVLSGSRTVFLMGMFKPCFLVVVLVLLGYPALHAPVSWGTITAYMVAVFYLMNQLQQLVGNLATLNKFYPHLLDYLALTEDVARTAPEHDSNAATVPPRLIIRSTGKIPNGANNVQLCRGDRAVLVVDGPLNRVGFMKQIAPLVNASSVPGSFWQRARFVCGRYRFVADALIANLCGEAEPEAETRRRIRSMLKALGVLDEVEALPEGLSTELTDELWEKMSLELQAATRAIALVMSESPVVFLELEVFKTISRESVEQFLALFADRFLFLTGPAWRITWALADVFIVTQEGEVAGMGNHEWFTEWRADREERTADGSVRAQQRHDDLEAETLDL